MYGVDSYDGEEMSIIITYDVVGHFFFCDGHVDEQEFLESLWEQWSTDFSSLNVGSSGVHKSYARWVRGNPGYLLESTLPGSKPITVIKGSVVGLGPEVCGTCGKLMVLESSVADLDVESEFWVCQNCRTEVDIRRPR
jgi:hypothetical protein